MILDRKQPVPDSPPTPDCPPSYDTLVPLDSNLLRDIKPRFGSGSSGYGRLPTSPLSPPITSPLSPSSSSSTPKGKGKARSWFDFAAIRTSREVQTTISGLVRDLVRDHYADSAAPAGILQSCADAAAAHDLDLSSILQDKFIEGHTPLYWAIVKRKPDEELDDGHSVPDLLTALISHTAPLTQDTIAEIRLACLVTSDQKLFQRLRMSPEFSMVSGAEQMLLGVTQSQDEVEVHEVAADDGSFAVDFVIPHFQKRLRVAQNIELEFIARSRMWKLAWVVAKPHQFPSIQGGSWCIVLSLQENSPPTWLDSRLVVYDPETSGRRSSPPSPSLWKKPKLPAPSGKPPIDIRLQTSMWQLEAIRGRAEGHGSSYLIKPLEKDPSATTLQYNGTSYIAADEKLRGRFEAKLRKPANNDADCIIC